MYKDLHVLNTPFVTLRSGSPAGVLLLKAFFLESIPSVYKIRILVMMSRLEDENHQLTNAVPPISRLDSEAVRGRRWTRVFGLPRTLCSLFL
jgi:hypothetical protein